jgi:glycosyltransferase involved in cell wall biosynthesis
MRIAHVTTIPLTAKAFLLRLFCSMLRQGHDVSTISSAGEGVEDLERHGVRHVTVPLTRRITPVRDILAIVRMVTDMRAQRYHIVHTHTPKGNLLGLLAARIAGVPLRCCTIHGLYMSASFPLWKNMLFALIEWFTGSNAHLVFLINREDVSIATRFRILPSSKIRLLDGGVGLDLTRFDPNCVTKEMKARERTLLGIEHDAIVVGFVGRLVEEKGVLELLQVAEKMRTSHPLVRFLFVGPSDHAKRDAITPESVRSQGLGSTSVFVGPRTDMPLMYAGMDVLCLPSYREGFGMVLAEAGAMGLPVIASDLGGCREIVDDAVNGILIPAGNIDALFAAIARLVEDEALRRHMGEQGRRMARDRFDDTRINEHIYREYLAAMEGR